MPHRPALARAVRIVPTLTVAMLLLMVWRAELPSFASGSTPLQCAEGYVQKGDFTDSVSFPDPLVTAVQGVTVTGTLGGALFHGSASGAPTSLGAAIRLIDPLTGAPATNTATLASLGTVELIPGQSDWFFLPLDRPIVLSAVTGTFSTVTGTFAVVLDVASDGGTSIDYQPNGDPGIDAAYRLLPGPILEPLPGAHPLLAHTFCADPETGTGLAVLQHVFDATITGTPSSTPVWRAQAFSVPTDGVVEWVELVLPANPAPGAADVRTIEIHDAGGLLVPPPGPLAVTTTAAILTADAPTLEGWLPSARFSDPPHLTAGELYWLVVREDEERPLGKHATGWPGHPLSERTAEADPFVEVPGALSFRLIGRPKPLLPSPSCPSPAGVSGIPTSTWRLNLGERAALAFDPDFGMPIDELTLPVALSPSAGVVTVTMHLSFAEPNGLPRTDTYPLTIDTLAPHAALRWTAGGFNDRTIVVEEVEGVAQSAVGGVGGGRLAVEVHHEAGTVPVQVGTGSWAGNLPADAFFDSGDGLGYSTVTSTMSLDICPSTDPTQDALRVLQQVVRATVACCPSTTPPFFEVVQSFRVPQFSRVSSVELALPAQPTPAAPLQLSIYDSGGLPLPPPGPLTPTSTSSVLDPSFTPARDRWVAMPPLAEPATLFPGQTYWLVLQLDEGWRVGTDESPGAYPDGLFAKRELEQVDQAFVEDPARDLSFRLLGEELSVSGVPPASPEARFVVRATPVPFASAIEISWSTVTSARVDDVQPRHATLEIVDPNGRMVRRVPRLPFTGRGRFEWDARDDAGRSVPAGVYFARVTSGSEMRAVKIVHLP